MSQIIKPKRRHTTGAPTTSDLVEGEIAVNTHDYSIYVRDDANNIIRVGGVQTPMIEDLDTASHEIKSTTSLDSSLGLPTAVEMGSYIKLKHLSTSALQDFTIDADQCEVGKRYMVASVGDTDWGSMGAPGTFFNFTIFTCTATGSGTGRCRVGDDYFGLLAYDPQTNYVVVYNEYDSDTGSGTAMRFGWQKLSKGQFN